VKYNLVSPSLQTMVKNTNYKNSKFSFIENNEMYILAYDLCWKDDKYVTIARNSCCVREILSAFKTYYTYFILKSL
jgi:hypothetical protein